MFEVGKRYNFKTVSHDGYSTWNATVQEVQGTLLRLEQDGKEWFFNVGASSFESAKITETDSVDISDFVINLIGKDGETTEYRPGISD